MKCKYLVRNVAKFIISQLSKLFFKDVLVTIRNGNVGIIKGSYVSILILPMPETGKDYADCSEYDPTKLIESFLEQYHADETRFYYYGGSTIDQKYGMISVDSNCLLIG